MKIYFFKLSQNSIIIEYFPRIKKNDGDKINIKFLFLTKSLNGHDEAVFIWNWNKVQLHVTVQIGIQKDPKPPGTDKISNVYK